MRLTAAFLVLLLGTFMTQGALAEPDKDSLIEAWEAQIEALPSTVLLEPIDEGLYRFKDTDLPYDGELKLVGALVRPIDSAGYDTGFSFQGMVDFQLTDMSVERMSSQVFYYWLNDRQTLHYSDAEQRWVDTAAYQASISEIYGGATSYGPLSFMLNYGIWGFLVALIIFVFVAAGRQARKARSLMDDSAAINQKVRENIDRAAALQDTVLGIAQETRDLQAENNELLKKMLDALKK